MRILLCILLISSFSWAQEAKPAPPSAEETSAKSATLTIPAGTRVPVSLRQPISTKTAREGDAVYANTSFPFVLNERVLVPAGTYVQGRISSVKRGGRIHGKAEVLIHFTTLIYPSGYTVTMPGAVENVPGAHKATTKGQEGTIQSDSQTGQKVGTAATTAATGAVVGGLRDGAKGALIGGGIGGAAGAAIAMLTRGNDVVLPSGTSIEMVIQRPISLDASRVPHSLHSQKVEAEE